MSGTMLKNEKILNGINVSRLVGLEIGPLDKPLVSKEKGKIYYVDRASTDELKKWYAANPNVNVQEIREVDYVWGEQTLADCVGSGNKFDYCVASHVLEHVPDLIGWLKEVAAVLKDGGIASFAVPDKRYTLDFNRSLTTPADLLDAYFQKYRKPSVRHIFDHFSNVVHLDLLDAWNPEFDKEQLKPTFSLKHAFNACKRAVEQGRYIDSHCWVFTSASFIEILKVLSELGLFDFRFCNFIDVEPNTFEFIAQFEKVPEQAEVQDKHRLFISSLDCTIPHEVSISMKSSRSGLCQLYYTLGESFNEIQTVSLPVVKTDEPVLLAFHMPPVQMNEMRLDLEMAGAEVEIESVDLYLHGNEHISIPLVNLSALNDFDRFELADDKIHCRIADRATDASIDIAMTKVFRIQAHYLRMGFSCSKTVSIQLYLDSGNGFTEKESVLRKLNPSERRTFVDFKIPRVGVRALRLDFFFPIENNPEIRSPETQAKIEIETIDLYLNGMEDRPIPLENLYPIRNFSSFELNPEGIRAEVLQDPVGSSIGIAMIGVFHIEAHYVRIRFSCSHSGKVQLYYDSGNGYHEEESTLQSYNAAGQCYQIDFMIPAVDLYALRFDPPYDNTGVICRETAPRTAQMVIESVEVYLNGMERHAIPLENLCSIKDISSFEVCDGAVQAEHLENAGDPSIGISLVGALQMQAHYVQIAFSCSKSGTAQLYYDSGNGYNEGECACHYFDAGEERIRIDFRLPEIPFKSLRFDPIQFAAEIKIFSVDIYLHGIRHHKIGLDRLKPVFDIESFTIEDGIIHIQTPLDAGDPSIEIDTSDQLEF
jgi:SAM-dependent methyltransferase